MEGQQFAMPVMFPPVNSTILNSSSFVNAESSGIAVGHSSPFVNRVFVYSSVPRFWRLATR